MLARRRRSAAVIVWSAAALLACALGGGGCRCDRDDPTPPGDTAGPPGGGDVAAILAEPAPQAVDRDLRAALAPIYGSLAIQAATGEEGGGGRVYTLTYRLGRAHARADGGRWSGALAAAGYAIDRLLDDPGSTALFAAHGDLGAAVIVSVDVGGRDLQVSIEVTTP